MSMACATRIVAVAGLWISCFCVHMENVVGGANVEEGAVPRIFTCDKWNEAKKEWTPQPSMDTGDRARLRCFITGTQGIHNCCISSMEKGICNSTISTQYGSLNGNLIHELGKVSCDMIGIYECSCGNDDKPLVKMGVKKCDPQPCDGTSEYTVPPGMRAFNVCIKCCDGISETAHLNGTALKVNTLSKDGRWSWNYTNGVYSRYSVQIELKGGSEQNYGKHTFTFFSNEGEEYKMDYIVNKGGPPECPKAVRVTENGTTHVSLKWTPGDGRGGGEQSFHVLHLKEQWKMALRVTENNATIHNLAENEEHNFRVRSSNEFGEATGCSEIIKAKTGSASDGNSLVQSFVLVIALSGVWWTSLRLMIGDGAESLF